MWPDDGTDLQLEVAAAFGADLGAAVGTWTWTDLTSRLQGRPIRGRAGRSEGARHVSPSTYTISLDNDDGRLTPLSPTSAYWPYVRRNTPIRIRVYWDGAWHTWYRYADQWQPTIVPTTSGTTSVVQLTCSGLLRRLEQGTAPARSAPRRYLPGTSPVAYWPLEDGQLAAAGSAVAGGQPMRAFTGTHPSGAVITSPQWGRGELAPWLPEVVSRRGNSGLTVIWAPVTMGSATRWCVDLMYRSGTDAGDSTVDANPSYLGGAVGWPQLQLYPSARAVWVAMGGEPEVTGTSDVLFDGQAHHIRWDVYQNAAKVSWNVYVDSVMVNFGTTTANMTLPVMSTLALAAAAQSGADLAQGHVVVWTSPPPVEDVTSAMHGHPGETAAARIERLCAEEGITVTVSTGDSEPMGPQGTVPPIESMREAEDTDLGVLYEAGTGLGYLARGNRHNPAVALAIDLATYRTASGTGAEVLVPELSDRGARNEWTVSRAYVDAPVTAVDSVHQEAEGPYSDSATVNVAADGRVADHASWRVHLGTVEVLRESGFPIDLGANPTLITAWLTCQVGSLIRRSNPPALYGPGPIDTIVEGWAETIGPRGWTVQVVPSPAGPWTVGTYGPASGAHTSRRDTAGSTLALAVDADDTAWQVATTAGPLWTTQAADLPLDLYVAGEQVRVTAISGTSSPQAMTVTRGVNGVTKAHAINTPVRLWQPAIRAL